jgi:hypothetical protein
MFAKENGLKPILDCGAVHLFDTRGAVGPGRMHVEIGGRHAPVVARFKNSQRRYSGGHFHLIRASSFR